MRLWCIRISEIVGSVYVPMSVGLMAGVNDRLKLYEQVVCDK
jgi:hypothetical protein